VDRGDRSRPSIAGAEPPSSDRDGSWTVCC
jgi:hypothetical protein